MAGTLKKYSRGNLSSIETFVLEFKNEECCNNEFNIDEIPLAVLLTIFEPFEDDMELFLPYEINEMQAGAINGFLKNPIQFDFSKFSYDLQRYGNYDAII